MAINGFPSLSNNLLSALSETLLHSIWLGLVLAIAAALILVGTRRAAAAFRYNLLLGALIIFVSVSAYTFVQALGTNPSSTIVASGADKITMRQATGASASLMPVTATYTNWKTGLLTFMQLYSRQVVAVWLAIVLIRCLQLLIGLQELHGLCKRQIYTVSAEWEGRLNQLSKNMGINRMVRLAESGLAKVPVMLGHLKPMILLPIGMLTALSPAEVEAILIHELAHIRRRDYLVNVLQHLVEIIFFFNPAVLWVSAQIRKERENCCDDIVLEQTGNQISYIKALVACQEYQVQPDLAMAIQGQKGSLLDRVNRMISGKNASLNPVERYVLALCLMVSCIFLLGFSNPHSIQTVSRKAVQLVPSTKQEAPVAPKTTKSTANRAQAVKKVDQQSPLPADTSRRSKKQKKTGSLSTHSSSQTTVQTNTNVNTNVTPVTPVPPVVRHIPATPGRTAVTSPVPLTAKQDDVSDKVLADMVRDGLISKSANAVSFKLSNTAFEVNGQLQPEAIFQRYRRKYVPETKPGSQWSLYRNYSQNSNTTTKTVQTP